MVDDVETGSLKALVARYERSLILAALNAVEGHQRRAAARLRLLPSTLHEKLKRHGIGWSRSHPLRGPGAEDPAPLLAWKGRIAGGSTLELAGLDGAVRVDASEGDEVRVWARRRAPGTDAAAAVDIRVLEHRHGVSVCAVRTGLGASGGVELEAEVPRGVGVAARTTNGDVEIVGLAENVEAATTNGRVVFLPAVVTSRERFASAPPGPTRFSPGRPSPARPFKVIARA
jgi:hypothetical protein